MNQSVTFCGTLVLSQGMKDQPQLNSSWAGAGQEVVLSREVPSIATPRWALLVFEFLVRSVVAENHVGRQHRVHPRDAAFPECRCTSNTGHNLSERRLHCRCG